MNIIKIPTEIYPEAQVKWGRDASGTCYVFWLMRDSKDTLFPWNHPGRTHHHHEGVGQLTIEEVERDARNKLAKESAAWKEFVKTDHGKKKISELKAEFPNYDPFLS